MKALRFALTLVMFAFSLPALAVELRDGVLVPTFPQEIALLEQCKKPGACFVVTREIVQAYAQNYANEQVAELQAEVRENFAKAVADEVKGWTTKMCKNSI